MVNIIENVVQTVVDNLLHQAHIGDGPPPLEVDDDGWLTGDGAERTAPSPKCQQLAPGLEHIEGIVTHWTDTKGCGAMNLAKRILSTDGRAASWHAVIDATGAIVQSVSAKKGSWHAGGPQAALFQRQSDGSWVPLSPAQRGQVRGYGANSWTFGIEMECVGDVRLVGDEWLGWPFKRGTQYGAPVAVPAAEVAPDPAHAGRGWHKFSDPQIASLGRVVAALVARYALRRDACALGHCQIDPENRTDPGPLMLGSPVPPWGANGGHLKAILDHVFGS